MSAIVSTFLFVYVGPLVGALWLLAVLLVEAAGYGARRRILKGDHGLVWTVGPNTFLISLLWVLHAVLLWRAGGEIPRIAGLMDLFTVALYAVVGAHTILRNMLALLAPPLVTLAALLTFTLLADAPLLIGVLGAAAALGACAMMAMNGLVLHRSAGRLARANAELQAVSDDLHANKSFLEEVSDLARLGGWRIDPQSGQSVLSRSGRAIFETPEDRVLDLEALLALLPEASRRQLSDAITAAKCDGTGWDLEVEALTFGGRRLHVRSVGRPAGGEGALVGAIQDVTERVETRKALEALAEAARAANHAKDGFLANMSHEIRTPLNGVVAMAAALLETELSPRQREMTELIHRSGDTLERLLADLLDLSRIESGKLEINEEVFDLHQSVTTAAAIMRGVAEAKGLCFSLAFSPGAQGLFLGDSLRIRQIVSNLASNAVKFTDRGAVALTVDAAPPADGAGPALVSISVRDTGVGFDDAVAARLFERFEQGDGSITRRFGGTGLGLSISQALAERMGGRIEAASTPGCGATFTLRLPLKRALEAVAPEGSAGAPAAAHAPADPLRLRPLRVLVAEDHPVNKRAFELILETLGVETVGASNGAEALEAALAGAFDLILMDMQMPVMDGLSATRAIRTAERARGGRRTPIAMVSANAMAAHVALALEAGCDFHLAKPITPARLAEGVKRALELAAAEARRSETLAVSEAV